VTLSFRSAVAFLFLAAPVALIADDWPMLGGKPDRNQVSPEKGLPVTWDADKGRKNIKWMVELGKTTYGTPVISQGRVFVGTNNDQPRDPAVKGDKGILMCFAEADGKFLWQAVHDKLPTGDAEDFNLIGIASSPCVVGDRLYYVSNRAELVCRTTVDGKLLWLLDMRKELGVSPHQGSACSPLVVGDLVFTLTGQGVDFKKHVVMNPKAPSFIAVNRETGKVVWQDSSPGKNLLAGQWGSPSYGVVDGRAQVLFPGGDGWLYSFDPPTGKLLWKFNCKAHEKRDESGNPETQAQLLAAPVIVGYRVVVPVGIDTDTNAPGCLRAIDARKSGDVTATAELWRLAGENFSCSIATVAVQDGLVYAVDHSGFISCIELETGKRLWKHDSLSTIWGSPLLADGKLYVRTGDEEVLIFQAGREGKPPVKIAGLPSVGNGAVVAANGVLYFAGNKALYAVAEGK
jgi:outer membrane protein assembly factor BamB